MKLSIENTIKQIKEFWKKQSKKSKIIYLGSVGAALVIAVILGAILNSSDYVNLYSGLDSSEAGEIIVRLDEMGISYKVNDSGTIMVPREEEAKLKMTLAAEGYPKTTLNYDLFTSNSGFMTTDYEKEKYLVFQLQNRLQEAIKTIQGIEDAIVTISIPEEDSFVLAKDKVPATASMVLSLSGLAELDSRQIKGIEALVSKSVPGLTKENVAIIDDMGNMLNSNESSDGQVGYTRLELEKSISTAMENRISKLFTPVFGAGGFRVAVNTAVDTSHKKSEQTTYSPVVGDNGVVSHIEQASENSGGGKAAGGVPGTGSNTETTTYLESSGSESGDNSSDANSTDYLVNQLIEQVENDGYEISDLSVAVMVGKELTGDELEEYAQMAAFATGVSKDKIVVTTAEFLNSDETKAQSGKETAFGFTKQQIIILAGACGALFLLALVFIIFSKAKRKKHIEEDDERPGLEEMLSGKAKEKIPGQIVLNETREQGLKRQIKEFTEVNPEIVAQLLRTWIKEDSEESNG